MRIPQKTPKGILVSSTPVKATVDSGACDNVCPPAAFPETPINPNSSEVGKCYGACGGETVKNIGEKRPKCLTPSGTIQEHTFQVGDKITKPLLAVSKICEKQQGVWFGPGPAFESFICTDPEAFVVHTGEKIQIELQNGTYNMTCREVIGEPKASGLQAVGPAGEGETPIWYPERNQWEFLDGQVAPNGRAIQFPDERINPEIPPIPNETPKADTPPEKQEKVDYRADDEVKAKVKPNPLKPTDQQIEQHRVKMHIPYRSWCEDCVKGSGREDAHAKSTETSVLPVFSCDYAFLKNATAADSIATDPDKITLFILKERKSKAIFATVCPVKGTETQAATELFLDAIEELGYKDSPILYKSDQEPSILAVLNEVSRLRLAKTSAEEVAPQSLPESSPVGSSQSNGEVEGAVGIIKGHLRRAKLTLENHLNAKLPLQHKVVPWMLLHVCF